ncbi:hypothetical protein T06_3512 [Trichinella sp. T6]|nr:hypothetical protein T06_3512 [Trichinella sp. T6]
MAYLVSDCFRRVFLTSQLPAMSGCLYRKCQPQLCRFAGNTKDLR